MTGGLADVSDLQISLLQDYELNQNYPNPFNPFTQIKYSLPVLSRVTISVYDVLGNKVIDLVNKKQISGSYEIEFDGSTLSSGVYFYTLIVNDNISQTKKMLLVK